MKNDVKIVYSINTEDIQDVANEVLERNLTKKELASVQESVGDYIDWFQAIENAIDKHVSVNS
jgi:hypothetical protein